MVKFTFLPVDSNFWLVIFYFSLVQIAILVRESPVFFYVNQLSYWWSSNFRGENPQKTSRAIQSLYQQIQWFFIISMAFPWHFPWHFHQPRRQGFQRQKADSFLGHGEEGCRKACRQAVQDAPGPALTKWASKLIHTHTHIYIYMYIWTYIYIYI